MTDLTEIPDFLRRRPKIHKPSSRSCSDDHERMVRGDRNGSSGSQRSEEDRTPKKRVARDA